MSSYSHVCPILTKIEKCQQIIKIPISDFTKILPVWVALFHAYLWMGVTD